MGSLMAPSDLTWGDLKRSKPRSLTYGLVEDMYVKHIFGDKISSTYENWGWGWDFVVFSLFFFFYF